MFNRIAHTLNPLHLWCRLVDVCMKVYPRSVCIRNARSFCILYEKVLFKKMLRIIKRGKDE